jgi:hypothetical protein
LTLVACFDELVEEYTRLIERLEDRQWTMKVANNASRALCNAWLCNAWLA